jgi:type I restriction enzyme R subunit
LLTTGVDAKTCKLIVLDQNINSMTEFKQIIGRGTRLREDYQKLYFTIMDFKGATRLFFDEDFDGEPVMIYEPKPDDPILPNEEITLDDITLGATGDSDIEDLEPPIYDTNTSETSHLDQSQRRSKYVIDDVNVKLAVQLEQYLDADGKLITEDYRVLLKADIQKTLQAEFGSLSNFLRRWNESERKQAVLEQLLKQGISLQTLQKAVPKGTELDAFDLVAHVAFNQKPLTRRERANQVKKRDVFGKYSEQAKAVLEALLDKFSEHGVQDIEDPKVLELPPFDQFGSKTQIRRGIFGGVDEYSQAIHELEQALYDDKSA